jgi:PAS domain S-box-containing protein
VKLSRPPADATDQLHALQRLAAIVSGSQDAILAKNLDGRITDWNPAAERLFGLTAEEAVGQHVAIVIPPDRLEEERMLLRRVLAGEGVHDLRTERLRRDGTRIQVSLTCSPIHGDTVRTAARSACRRSSAT